MQRRKGIVLLILILGLFSLYSISTSFPQFGVNASNVAFLEAESGVATGLVMNVADTTASSGRFMRFTPASTALKPTCTDSLQAQINNASAGTVLKVRTDCIYRESNTFVNKPLTLDGQGGAEIRGSDIWGNTEWTQAGSYWVSTKTLPRFYNQPARCKNNVLDAPCQWPEQVFLDGTPLQQVATTAAVTSGQFNMSPTRQIQLFDNPINHVIEVTTRNTWIYAYADNVTIQGFTMKHSANPAQSGGIKNYRYGTVENPQFSNMTIQNNVLSDAHGGVVSFIKGSGNRLLNNDISRGGDLGVHASYSNPFIKGNKIHDNNTEQYSEGWESGGLKSSKLDGAVIDGNTSYNNAGPGIWCDGDCTNLTISNNNVHDNNGPGIFFEISDGVKIFGNKVWENGWGWTGWVYGAGIMVSSSSNAEVYNNVVAWNGDGISVISQCRAHLTDGTTCDLAHKWNNVKNNYIHDNSIIHNKPTSDKTDAPLLAWARDIKDANGTAYTYMESTQANNQGANNKYWSNRPDNTYCLFSWAGCVYTLSSFNATPAEENGRYLTETEKNTILQNAGIPLTPLIH